MATMCKAPVASKLALLLGLTSLILLTLAAAAAHMHGVSGSMTRRVSKLPGVGDMLLDYQASNFLTLATAAAQGAKCNA
jgi:hypothetical protein